MKEKKIPPWDKADTTPELVTEAMVGVVLAQVPPVVGLRVIELPIHKLVKGVLTTGLALIVTGKFTVVPAQPNEVTSNTLTFPAPAAAPQFAKIVVLPIPLDPPKLPPVMLHQ